MNSEYLLYFTRAFLRKKRDISKSDATWVSQRTTKKKKKKKKKKMGKANQANSTWLRCLLIPWGLHRQTLFIFVLHWHKPRVDSSGLCIYPCALNRTTSWAKCTVLLFLSAASWFESQTQSLIQKSFEPLSVCCLLMDEGQRATTVPRFLVGCYPSGTDDGWLARLFIYLF